MVHLGNLLCALDKKEATATKTLTRYILHWGNWLQLLATFVEAVFIYSKQG